MKVLIIPDVPNWSSDHTAREIQKYITGYKVEIKQRSELPKVDFERYDLILAMLDVALRDIPKHVNIPICVRIAGWYAVHRVSWRKHRKVAGVAALNYNMYQTLKNIHPNVHYTPNGIDLEVFKVTPKTGQRFNVGWVGNAGVEVKQHSWTENLGFKIDALKGLTLTDWPRQMVEYYKRLDCLAYTSSFEGFGRPILEASASGLPVVSTPCGIAPLVLHPKWIAPTLQIMRKLLQELDKKIELRLEVGRRNRREVERNWGWEQRVKSTEKLFASCLETQK